MKIIFTTLAIFLCILSSFAQPGTLDNSFGNGGIVVDPTHNTLASHIALQKDGKLIAAGCSSANRITSFLLCRYNPDGTKDTAFGEKGAVTTHFYPSSLDICYAVSIQPNGKTIAAGTTFTTASGYEHVAVTRYNEDGSLDKSFGKEGLVDLGIAPQTHAYVVDMALQTDGKIVIAGNSLVNSSHSYLPFILRCNADGTADTEFGDKGIVFTSFDNSTEASSVLLQPDGNILLGGTYAYFNNPKILVARYLPDGMPDKNFGAAGVAKQSFGNGVFSQLNSIALQKDGSIVCGGSETIYNGATNIGMIRLTISGSLDSSFGIKGQVITIFKNWSEIKKVLLQTDGKIIGAGVLNPDDENSTFATVRYDADGTVDSSFGKEGLTITTMQNGLFSSDALLQENGKIIVAGLGFIDSIESNVFVLARYNNEISKKQQIITKIKRWIQHQGITWQTDNGVRYYNVQRSNDGGITYQPVAKIYNNRQPRYSYEEPSVKDNSLYRVAVVGKDGSRTYSNSILINNDASVSVFPNPVRNNLQVQGLAADGKTNISITDFSGSVRTSAVASGGTYSVNTANLKPGNYLLKVQHDNTVTTKTFVKE